LIATNIANIAKIANVLGLDTLATFGFKIAKRIKIARL
jgi:hypothetical protein